MPGHPDCLHASRRSPCLAAACCAHCPLPNQVPGLPLSVFPLRWSDYQSLIDRVTKFMPTWKASLMNKVGRLTTVKAVMTTTCVHTMISLRPRSVSSERAVPGLIPGGWERPVSKPGSPLNRRSFWSDPENKLAWNYLFTPPLAWNKPTSLTLRIKAWRRPCRRRARSRTGGAGLEQGGDAGWRREVTALQARSTTHSRRRPSSTRSPHSPAPSRRQGAVFLALPFSCPDSIFLKVEV